jgi:hypothetical protein
MSSVSLVTRLFLFVCRSVVEREREREREKENVSKCATKTNHTTSRERREPIFFFLKRKKASDQTGEEEESKAGRALLLSPPINQTQRRQNASGSGYVRLMRESSKTKKRLEIENFERFSKTNSHPFSEHVNGHRLFLSW